MAWAGIGRRLVFLGALAVAGVAQQQAQAQELRLTLPEARTAASQLLSQGKPEAALILAEGILLGAPGDVAALLLKARALRDMGRMEAAKDTARAAWRTADTDRDKFFAALVVAQSRAAAGQSGWAQYWLRRAAQEAPDEGLRQMAVQDFRQLRRMTPWRFSVNMFMQPSDNLNDAPANNTEAYNDFFSITRVGAVPLSGVRYGVNGQLRYAIPTGDTSRVNLLMFGGLSRAHLSRDARKVAGADADDYRTEMLGFGLNYEQRGARKDRLGRVGMSVLRQWQGGTALADVGRVDLSYSHALTGELHLSGRIGVEKVWRLDTARGDTLTRSIGLSLAKPIGPGRVSLDIERSDTQSDVASIEVQKTTATLSYGLSQPVKGMLPRVSLTWGAYDYATAPILYSFSPTPREDREWALGVDVLLTEWDYYGFAPEIGVSFSDRRSNYGLYESRSTDLRLGLKSVF